MPTTVILGAGIIGLASAHALARLAPPDHRIHLVEAAPRLFASASGKAAGFLAKDWFAPAVAPLGLLSFNLHRSLAEQHNGAARWGYAGSISYSLDHTYLPESGSDAPTEGRSDDTPGRTVLPDATGPGVDTTDKHPGPLTQGGLDWLLIGTSRATVVDANAVDVASSADVRNLPKWLRARPEALESISDTRSTAQVHPLRLCEFLLEQCLAAGVTLHHPAHATKLLRDEEDRAGVTRVRVMYLNQKEERGRVVDIACENIVIAAGCWIPQVYATLFPNAGRVPRTAHLAGYSVTIKTATWPPVPIHPAADDATASSDRETSTPVLGSPNCHAIFTDAAGFAPEVFSRATGDIWVGGLNPPNAPLPPLPTEAQVDAGEIERLLAIARALCGDEFEVRERALCFRPVSATGRPIIARMHEADLGDGPKPPGLGGAGGVFIATGHGPWGISLSLGTGQVVAEMVLGRETSADVVALSRW